MTLAAFLDGVYAHAHILLAAFVGWTVFLFIAHKRAVYVFRGHEADKREVMSYDEVSDNQFRWAVLFIRQDLSQLYGMISVAVGLLGSILFVMIAYIVIN